MELAQCDGCRRHVRVEEQACPFCGGSVGGVAKPTRAGLPPRYVALFAASLGACAQGAYGGPPPVPEPRDSGSETRVTQPLVVDDDPPEPENAGVRDDAVYGVPPADGGK